MKLGITTRAWFSLCFGISFALFLSPQEAKTRDLRLGVSRNYGDGADNSTYGALKTIDGNLGTQWSSNGDGDKAWIEIELANTTRVTRIGFWTCTMGSSAQIKTFRIITDKRETLGTFKLKDGAQIYYFDTNFTAKQLHFEAVTPSGGNMGAVEIEVYGEAEICAKVETGNNGKVTRAQVYPNRSENRCWLPAPRLFSQFGNVHDGAINFA